MREIRNDNIRFFYSPHIRDEVLRLHEIMLENYMNIYNQVYADLSNNYEKGYKKFFDERIAMFFQNNTGLFIQEKDYRKEAREYALKRIEEQKLMYYQFVLMSISNLYQVFEQKLRRWLYDEMTEYEVSDEILAKVFDYEEDSNNYSKFCTNFGALESLLRDIELTITINTTWRDVTDRGDMLAPIYETELIAESKYWGIIRECSLLSNTYKHGCGRSARELMKLKPNYFLKNRLANEIEYKLTTNLEMTLAIENISYEYYHNAFTEFWERITIIQFYKKNS